MLYENAKKHDYSMVNYPGGVYSNLYKKVLEQNHVLIAGASGSGKSVFLNGLIRTVLTLSANDRQLVLLDPKRVEFNQYKYMPHTYIFADEAGDIARALEKCVDLMEYRYQQMQKSGSRLYDGADIYIILDELADVLLSEYGKQIEKHIQRIAQLGRAARLHMIVATQCPSRQILRAPVIVNLDCRIALHCMNSIESRQIINMPGAENLPKYGECMVRFPGQDVFIHDVKMYSEEELNDLVNYYLQQRKNTGKSIDLSSAVSSVASFDFKKFVSNLKVLAGAAIIIYALIQILFC